MSEKKAFSFSSDLFGTNDNSSSSSYDIFGSIFSKGSQHSEVGGKSQAFSWHPKSEGKSKYNEWKNQSTSSKEMSSFRQEQTAHPCHFSSSIYYGGQDFYTQNPGTRLNSSIKKDEGEDDSGGACRGNWWQGSLYY